MEEGAGFGQDRQRWGLRAGELSMDGQENQQPKSKDKQNGRFHVRPYDGIGIVREDRHRGNHTPLPSEPQLADRIIVRQTGHTESVYDIRNCGPRHRFAVYDPGAGCLRIVSNCTQAIARDLLAEAMWRMERAGLDIVGHVHDEVIIEAPRDTVTVDDVCSIMNETPDWAGGLILNSAGYSGDYYFKD